MEKIKRRDMLKLGLGLGLSGATLLSLVGKAEAPRLYNTNFQALGLEKQASAPPTPEAGWGIVYIKSDSLWWKDDAGVEHPLQPKIEGDFTSWSLLKKLDNSGYSSDSIAIAYVNSGETFAIILNASALDPNRLVKWDLLTNTTSILASVDDVFYPYGKKLSVLRKYMVHVDYDNMTPAYVHKDGLLQDSLYYGDYGGLADSLINGVSITADGKYILITFVDNGGADLHWSLMKGA